MQSRLVRPLALPLLFSLAAAAPQGELFTFPGQTAVNVGDLDGDGKSDYLIGEPNDSGASAGRVVVYSALTGAPLVSYQPIAPVTRVGDRVAALGDVDGDGTLDFATLEIEAATQFIAVISGANGARLYRFAGPTPQYVFGAFIGIDDVDGDGRPDLADGELANFWSVPFTPGSVRVRFGANGTILRTIVAPAGESGFGFALDLHEDLDLDGVRDLLVGAPETSGGAAYVVSLATGATLFTSSDSHARYGAAVASLGDADGDGISDIAVGDPGYSTATPPADSSVRVVSVPGGATISTVQALYQQIYLGASVERIGDFDGDGLADVLMSAGHYRVGCCHWYPQPSEIRSGLTGALLYTGGWDRETALDALGDVDGNGTRDYLASAHDTALGVKCSVVLANRIATCLADHCWYPENHDSIGCTPNLGAWGAPSLTTGDDFVMRVAGVRNNRRGVIVWSTNWMPGTFAGQSFCVGAPRHVLGALWSGGLASGANCTGLVDLPLPKPTMAALGWTAGQALVAQAVFRDPNTLSTAQVSLTDAIGIYVWP